MAILNIEIKSARDMDVIRGHLSAGATATSAIPWPSHFDDLDGRAAVRITAVDMVSKKVGRLSFHSVTVKKLDTGSELKIETFAICRGWQVVIETKEG